jgi:hypothetical protein
MAETGLTDTMWAGNKRVLAYTVEDSDAGDGSAKDLTGLTVKWALSKMSSDGTYSTTAILEKATGGNGITVTDAAAGELEVDLDAADTSDLAGDYYFELEVYDATPEGVVVATGTLTINRNVVNTL